MPVFISLVCVCKQRSHFVLGVLQVITKGKRIAGEEEAVNCLQQGRNLLVELVCGSGGVPGSLLRDTGLGEQKAAQVHELRLSPCESSSAAYSGLSLDPK